MSARSHAILVLAIVVAVLASCTSERAWRFTDAPGGTTSVVAEAFPGACGASCPTTGRVYCASLGPGEPGPAPALDDGATYCLVGTALDELGRALRRGCVTASVDGSDPISITLRDVAIGIAPSCDPPGRLPRARLLAPPNGFTTGIHSTPTEAVEMRWERVEQADHYCLLHRDVAAATMAAEVVTTPDVAATLSLSRSRHAWQVAACEAGVPCDSPMLRDALCSLSGIWIVDVGSSRATFGGAEAVTQVFEDSDSALRLVALRGVDTAVHYESVIGRVEDCPVSEPAFSPGAAGVVPSFVTLCPGPVFVIATHPDASWASSDPALLPAEIDSVVVRGGVIPELSRGLRSLDGLFLQPLAMHADDVRLSSSSSTTWLRASDLSDAVPKPCVDPVSAVFDIDSDGQPDTLCRTTAAGDPVVVLGTGEALMSPLDGAALGVSAVRSWGERGDAVVVRLAVDTTHQSMTVLTYDAASRSLAVWADTGPIEGVADAAALPPIAWMHRALMPERDGGAFAFVTKQPFGIRLCRPTMDDQLSCVEYDALAGVRLTDGRLAIADLNGDGEPDFVVAGGIDFGSGSATGGTAFYPGGPELGLGIAGGGLPPDERYELTLMPSVVISLRGPAR